MSDDRAQAVVVLGVSGSGKTTVGRRLAERLGWVFVDADDLHPPENVDKMRRGLALDDTDRAPWLDAVRARIEASLAEGRSIVFACSALKRAYRERLTPSGRRVRFVYLKGDRALLAQRLGERSDHFFDPGLLDSQLETLEEPSSVLVVDIADGPEELTRRIEKLL